ncbi:MAG: glycosyltransferase family 2 protein [Chloroflexi bacterium]|nr:glycosyltransferase family 2 protein [Chloroflexota bacterium]
MADAPRWSVVIPTWNGRHLLAEALDGLSRQTLRDFETIVVDDASDDDTCHWLRQHRPEVVSVELAQRRGLAHAINQGLAVARAERIAFLNNDAVPEPEWLGELDRAFDEHPDASMLASRILLYATPDRLHAAGDFFTASGLPGNRGVWQRDGAEFDEPREVFGACAAAAAYRRLLFDTVGGLDEDLMMYCEDVDLSWRAQLAGHRCRYVPTARVRHRRGASATSEFESFLVGRNRPLVAVMNVPGYVMRRRWWSMLRAQGQIALDALRNFQGRAARATLNGQVAAIPQLGRALRKRRRRQRTRTVSEAYVWSLLD